MKASKNIKAAVAELDYRLKSIENFGQSDARSFLDIIRKGDHEVYITEILAYLLNPFSNNGNNLCVQLLAKMLNCDISNLDAAYITTNKYASGDFIDIFIYIPHKLVIVLENKIWSQEHNHQTQKYYEFCEKTYPNVERKYMLLKPTCHVMDKPYCNIVQKKQIYNVVNYKELVKEVLEVVRAQKHNDANYQRILEDFIEHCKRRFYMQEMLLDEDTKIYLEHLEAIKYLENKYCEKMKYIKNTVSDYIVSLGYEKQPADRDEVYRYYKKDWYDDVYYLYFEVKYNENNLNNVVCQITLKNYTNSRNNKSKQDRFSAILDALKDFSVYTIEYDNYYIFAQEQIICNDIVPLETYISNITKTLRKFAQQAEKMHKIILTVK